MIQDLSYACSNCEKTVLGVGVFLSSNGIQEGFCSFDCVYQWLGKKFHEKKALAEKGALKKLDKIEKKSRKLSKPQAPIHTCDACDISGRE